MHGVKACLNLLNAKIVISQNCHTKSVKIAGSSSNMDPRHQKRIKILQNLFTYSFKQDEANFPNQDELKITKDIIKHISAIDKQIVIHAPKFPLDKIAKIDLAILRLSIHDLTITRREPPKVIIDEAVELAKEFGSNKSFAFINAILGKIYDDISKKEK